MGEVISLKEYRDKILEDEIEELRQKLKKIIQQNDLYVENLPYFSYNCDYMDSVDIYVVHVTPPNFY
jgi:hypothetical protein